MVCYPFLVGCGLEWPRQLFGLVAEGRDDSRSLASLVAQGEDGLSRPVVSTTEFDYQLHEIQGDKSKEIRRAGREVDSSRFMVHGPAQPSLPCPTGMVDDWMNGVAVFSEE